MPSIGSNGPGYYDAYPITNSAMRKLMYYAPGCYGYEHSYDAQAIAFFTGYEPQNGSLSLKKAPVSGSEECVKDNLCYSLEGAAYELHNADTDALVGTFTVNADGTTYADLDIVSIYKAASGSSKEEVIASLIKTAEDNKLLYATADFMAEGTKGQAEVVFTYDAVPFAGGAAVAAEAVYPFGKVIIVNDD